ncbi:HNH endonuclease [Neobacillus niacini]|uniref:HNH endonuclease n=1 Tax=Neobacillus niacini TaxID=86668 RepID=UPI001C8E4049|nr:HNH endonuclease [Neobacillus niacini]MBY0144258.1 HNH endonuclease [Neobacillus niacini]
MSQTLRTCRICGEVKARDEFERDKRYEGGRTTRCKSCKAKSTDRAYHAFYKLKLRAEMAGNEVAVTLEEIKALLEAFGGICIYCGAKEEPNGPTFHVEHVRARSQGGADHINNLVISCPTCNSKKSDKSVIGYYFDEESFTDENLKVLVQYLALSADKKVEELLVNLVDDFAISEVRKIREEMEKEVK